MASNPNDSLSNRHCIYVASSGGGKTQAMAANVRDQGKQKRLLIWDTHSSFLGLSCGSLSRFGKALIDHVDKNDFSICYQGRGGEDNFSLFCQMVWEFARGDKETFVIVDELADCTDSIGKDRSGFGELLRGGRKYGLIIHSTAVSVAEVPNTVWRESKTKWIGTQDNTSDIKRCAESLITATQEDIRSLEPLQFLVKTPDNKVKKRKIRYRKSPHRL